MGAKSATHIKESLTIYCCQVDELDCPDLGNIDHVRKDVVSLWQEIIRCSGQPTEVDTDIDCNQHKSNLSNYPDFSTK